MTDLQVVQSAARADIIIADKATKTYENGQKLSSKWIFDSIMELNVMQCNLYLVDDEWYYKGETFL